MREIIITTESGSDLPENLVKKYDIKVIPMHIVMDATSYADGTISVDKIYEYYNETKKIPTTSAVNVEKKLPGKKRMTEFWENARALRFLHGVIEGRNLIL